MYVYRQTERQLYTVGFYDPSGKWHPETDHASQEEAARRTAWLNGSSKEQPQEDGLKKLDQAVRGMGLEFVQDEWTEE